MNSGKSQAKYVIKSACHFPWLCYNILTPPLRAAYGRQPKKSKPLGLAFSIGIC